MKLIYWCLLIALTGFVLVAADSDGAYVPEEDEVARSIVNSFTSSWEHIQSRNDDLLFAIQRQAQADNNYLPIAAAAREVSKHTGEAVERLVLFMALNEPSAQVPTIDSIRDTYMELCASLWATSSKLSNTVFEDDSKKEEQLTQLSKAIAFLGATPKTAEAPAPRAVSKQQIVEWIHQLVAAENTVLRWLATNIKDMKYYSDGDVFVIASKSAAYVGEPMPIDITLGVLVKDFTCLINDQYQDAVAGYIHYETTPYYPGNREYILKSNIKDVLTGEIVTYARKFQYIAK